MKLFDTQKPKMSASEMRQKEASVKHTLTFIMLLLMIFSLTMCSVPSYEEFTADMEDDTQQKEEQASETNQSAETEQTSRTASGTAD